MPYRSSRCVRVLTVFFALTLSVASTTAMKIDDFESGGFNLSTNSSTAGTQGPLGPLHCIAATRSVELQTGGDFVGATLNLGAVDDEVAIVMGATDATWRVVYLPPPSDLTGGGVFDAVRVKMTVAAAGGASLRLTLGDTSGASFEVGMPVTGPGKYDFLHADFLGVDPTLVDSIQLELHSNTQGDYHISDIAMWKDGAGDGSFDVVTPGIAGPPYPTSAIGIVLRYQTVSGKPVDFLTLSIYVENVLDPTGQPTMAEMTAMDSGGPSGVFGEQVAVEAGGSVPNATGKLPHFRTWDGIYYDFHSVGSFQITDFSAQTIVHPPDPGMPFAGAFTIQFHLDVRDGDSGVSYRTHLMAGFDANEEAGLSFSSIVGEESQAIPNSYRLSLALDSLAPSKRPTALEYAIIPLAAMVEELRSTATTPGNLGRLQISARPSVMASSTQLWLSRPVDRELELTVYDLAGRALRSLRVAANREFTTWDGRDGQGAPVASGIYYLRALQGDGQGPVAKVVKIR